MDKLRFKNPQRWVRKQLKELGLRSDSTDDHAAFFRAQTGAIYAVPLHLNAPDAIRLVTKVRTELGHSSRIPTSGPTPPKLAHGRVQFTQHARERWALMKTQAAVGGVELEACLFTPQEVRFDRANDSWLFITARLAAVVSVSEGRDPVLKTVMWSRPDLFEKNPRPEMSNA